MDLAAKLPDEVLCQVFSNVSSILDRSRLAAVNRKFRRCVFKEMKKPQRFEIDLVGGTFCGHQLAKDKLLLAIKALAKEARFSQIMIMNEFSAADSVPQWLHSLDASSDCLTQVTEINISWFFEFASTTENCLASLIGSCGKLSVLELNLTQVPIGWHEISLGEARVDLALVLKNKALTQLGVTLANYTQQEVIDLFHSLKPNTLRKLEMNLKEPAKNINEADLVRELCVTAGDSLEDLKIGSNHMRGEQRASDVFACISNLPALHRLSTIVGGLRQIDQFNAALKLLLSNHARGTQLYVDYWDLELNNLPNCQLLSRIRQLKRETPQLVFGFDHIVEMMKLSLGNVAIGVHSLRQRGDNPNCNDCGSCYPIVIGSLVRAARMMENSHLENRWLARCAVGHVVDKLNEIRHDDHQWIALNAAVNEVHDTATIIFERRDVTQFEITVNSGRCFDSCCMRCLVI